MELGPTPTDLAYFLAVMQTRNLSRASEQLGVRQSTLSLSLKRLEGHFGTRLAIRSKHGVRPTKEGLRLEAQGKELLERWDALKGFVLAGTTGISGRFSIGCHRSIGYYTLSRFLPDLLREHRELEFVLEHEYSRNITDRIIASQLDFGIVVNPRKHPDLVIRRLHDEVVLLWTSAQTEKNNPDVLIYDPEMHQSAVVMDQLSGSTRFSRHIAVPSLENIAQLVRVGAGVGIIPRRIAMSLEQTGAKGLRPVKKPGVLYRAEICLAYRADAHRSRSGQVIAKAIEAALKEKQ